MQLNLSVREIKDLHQLVQDDEDGTVMVIEQSHSSFFYDESMRKVVIAAHVAYYADLPEEGVFPLGLTKTVPDLDINQIADGDHVKLPETAEQAAAMMLVGELWLREHSPQYLKKSTSEVQNV